MGVSDSTYYGFTKIREMSPEARDWAAVDLNFEQIALMFKSFESHHHDGSLAIKAPAYYVIPPAPTVSVQGAAGTTTYSYYVVARGLVPRQVSQVQTITNGNATLNGTNFNRVSWTAIPGATGYDVIRVTGGATQGSISLNQGTTTFDDVGITATAYTIIMQPVLSEITTGGILPPGTNMGVRLSYINTLGLETDACPESPILLAPAAARPLAPQFVSTVAANPGLSGGTYVYVVTKVKGSGETVISDPLPVTVAYDQTYSVTVSFDAISTYTDGTTALNVYRSTGLSSSFQLLTTVTTTSQTTFTDTNNILPANANVQPPTRSTFDAAKKVRIDWSALTHPTGATKLRVYVTQQTGLWGTSSLLSEIDLTVSPPTFLDYLGSETLLTGWPKNTTQIPSNPGKVNLSTEATGAPTLSADMDFAGFQGKNLVLHTTVSPTTTNGTIYYDTSIPTVRARINGAWVNWGTTAATAYTHPSEESGGHIAANVKYKAGSAVTSKTIFDTLRNTSDGTQKQVTKIWKAAPTTSNPTTSIATASAIPELTITGVAADVNNAWTEFVFEAYLTGNAAGMNISVALEWDGSTVEETIRSYTVPFTNGNVPIHISFLNQIGTSARTIRALWWIDTGTAKAVGVRRSLTAKVLF